MNMCRCEVFVLRLIYRPHIKWLKPYLPHVDSFIKFCVLTRFVVVSSLICLFFFLDYSFLGLANLSVTG